MLLLFWNFAVAGTCNSSGPWTAFSYSASPVGDVRLGGVQCCHVLPFTHCEFGLHHLTRLYDIFGNTCEFGFVSRDQTESGRALYDSVCPPPTPHSSAFLWLLLAQDAREKECAVVELSMRSFREFVPSERRCSLLDTALWLTMDVCNSVSHLKSPSLLELEERNSNLHIPPPKNMSMRFRSGEHCT
jgi:hypothetical protein